MHCFLLMACFSQGDPSPGSCRGGELVMLCGAHHLQKCFVGWSGNNPVDQKTCFPCERLHVKTKDYHPVTACSQLCSKSPPVLTEISAEQCNTSGRASFSLQPCFKTTQLGQESILFPFNVASAEQLSLVYRISFPTIMSEYTEFV